MTEKTPNWKNRLEFPVNKMNHEQLNAIVMILDAWNIPHRIRNYI